MPADGPPPDARPTRPGGAGPSPRRGPGPRPGPPPGSSPPPAAARPGPPPRQGPGPGAPVPPPPPAYRPGPPTAVAPDTPTEARPTEAPTIGDLARRAGRWYLRRWRLLFALVAVALLAISGGTWWTAHTLDEGLSRADVVPTSIGTVVGGAQNVLLVGLDSRTDSRGDPLPAPLLAQLHAGASDSGGDQTDTLMVLHIPAGGGPISGFSIPRDSYVTLPDDLGKHKINSAYAYGQNAARASLAKQGESGKQLVLDAQEAGARTTVRAVADLTGLDITHFAAVNLAGFASISTAVGGVPVCLNAAVNDSFSGARLPAGPQTVAGPQALAFVRQRHGLASGDLARVRRQQVFLSSMARTLLSSDTLTDSARFDPLVDAVDRAVTVDSGWGVLGLATSLQTVSGGGIGFKTIPIVSAGVDTEDDGEVVQVDPKQVQRFVSDTTAKAGEATTTSPTPSPAPVRSAPAPARRAPSAPAPASSAAPAPASTVPCVD